MVKVPVISIRYNVCFQGRKKTLYDPNTKIDSNHIAIHLKDCYKG